MNAFSKDPDYLEHQLTLAFAYYHFVIPHTCPVGRGLRQRLPRAIPTKGRKGSYKKWKPVTPAMAACLTDHVWTMDELLSNADQLTFHFAEKPCYTDYTEKVGVCNTEWGI